MIRNRKKIYLAAAYHRKEEMRQVRDTLVKAGHKCTSSWLKEQHQSDADCTDEQLAEYAYQDMLDISQSDMLLMFAGEGITGGRHVEFGAAWVMGKRVAIIGDIENVFHRLPGVERYRDFGDFMTILGMRRQERMVTAPDKRTQRQWCRKCQKHQPRRAFDKGGSVCSWCAEKNRRVRIVDSAYTMTMTEYRDFNEIGLSALVDRLGAAHDGVRLLSPSGQQVGIWRVKAACNE